MTYLEALRILGLEVPTDAPAARRAYLALVKVHTPERDPEGFQRIRQAFEVAKGYLASRREDSRVLVAREVALSEREPSAAVAPSGEDVAQQAPSDPLSEVRERIATSDDASHRIALAQDAAATYGTEEAFLLWLDVLGADATEQRVADVARAAVARGHTRFLKLLRERCSNAMQPEELQAWLAETLQSPGIDALDLAWLFNEREEPQPAISILERVLEHASEHPLSPRPSAGAVLQLILKLLADGSPADAPRLFDAWQRSYGLDEIAKSTQPLMVDASRELMALCDRLEPTIVRAIAGALAVGAPERADHAFHDVAAADTFRAACVRVLIRKSGPALLALYGHLLPTLESEPRRESAGAPSMRGFIWALSVGMFFVMMLVRSCLPDSHSVSKHAIDFTEPAQERRPAWRLCRAGKENSDLCLAARQWENRSSCADASAAIARIVAASDPLVEVRDLTIMERKALSAILEQTRTQCGPESIAPAVSGSATEAQ